MHLKTIGRAVESEIISLILQALPGAQVQATGSGGHYSIVVTSAAFAGKSSLAKQRLVLSAIAPLMKGENAPLHTVDRLETLTPTE